MPEFDLMSMSKDELVALQKHVEKAIADYDARKKAEVRAAAEALAKAEGYSLAELLESGGAKGSKGIPKYAHPEDPSQTWTGRGRKPKWVEEHLAAGGDLKDLTIA